jgi:hypothetical protein
MVLKTEVMDKYLAFAIQKLQIRLYISKNQLFANHATSPGREADEKVVQ